jgi:ADP-ribose pyrophosphatase
VTYPRILDRKVTAISPWVTLVEKIVQFEPHQGPEVYHCLTQADYVGVIAITPDGLIPIVRQFRPAVEAFTWEFPAGTVEPGETPEDAARRELQEEAGLRVESIVNLGCFAPDTGRLQVKSHAFFARALPGSQPTTEPGLEIRFVTPSGLRDMIRAAEFAHQVHLAVYAAALVHDICAELRLPSSLG